MSAVDTLVERVAYRMRDIHDAWDYFEDAAEARGRANAGNKVEALVPASALEAVEEQARIAKAMEENETAIRRAACERADKAEARAEAAEARIAALEAENGALREKVERGVHLARTVSQTRFRLEANDRYSISMFDANNMVGLARADAFRQAEEKSDG